MQELNLPGEIKDWFLARGISEKILDESEVSFNGDRVVIPVKDINGKIIFNKYRRNPFREDGPKYIYDKGFSSALFNIHTITDKRDEDIFVTEGETDALLLNSFGLNAVSSTSGSGTFRPEWADYLKNNNIYIVYDRDEAGIRGALKVHRMLPFAKIIWLPHDTRGKDVTDYFQTHKQEDFQELKNKAEEWRLPYDPHEIPQKKSEIKSIIVSLISKADELMNRRRLSISNGQPTDHYEVLFEMIKNRKEHWEKTLKSFGVANKGLNLDDITRARAIPLSNFIKFNSGGFAPCLWHNERTPSMKWYYQRNKVYCFACNIHKDSIDVVMQQNSVDFNTALRLILGKPLQ